MDPYNWYQSHAPITMGGQPQTYGCNYVPVTMGGAPQAYSYGYAPVTMGGPPQWCETQSELQIQNQQCQIQSFMEDLQVRLQRIVSEVFDKFSLKHLFQTPESHRISHVCEPPPAQFQPPTPPVEISFQSQKEHFEHQTPTNPQPLPSLNQKFRGISQIREPTIQFTQHISPPFLSSTKNLPQFEPIPSNFQSAVTSFTNSQTSSAAAHQLARQLFDVMLKRNSLSINSISDGYVKLGMMILAPEMFDDMPMKLNLFYWNLVIIGYTKSEFGFKVAWELMEKLPKRYLDSSTLIVDDLIKRGRIKIVCAHIDMAGNIEMENQRCQSQVGSLVAFDRLSFDFNSHRPLSENELVGVEGLINRWIGNAALLLSDAKKAWAIALFVEKYREHVRVVEVPGVFMKLYSGSYATNIPEIGGFKLTSVQGIAFGIKLIEAIVGEAFIDCISSRNDKMKQHCSTTKVIAKGQVLYPLEKNFYAFEEIVYTEFEMDVVGGIKMHYFDLLIRLKIGQEHLLHNMVMNHGLKLKSIPRFSSLRTSLLSRGMEC